MFDPDCRDLMAAAQQDGAEAVANVVRFWREGWKQAAGAGQAVAS